MTYKIKRHLTYINLRENLNAYKQYTYFEGNTKLIVASIILLSVIIYHVAVIDLFCYINTAASLSIAELLFIRKKIKPHTKLASSSQEQLLLRAICIYASLFVITFTAITLVISFSWFFRLASGII